MTSRICGSLVITMGVVGWCCSCDLWGQSTHYVSLCVQASKLARFGSWLIISWAESLSVAGIYYDGGADESKLQEVLELHKRGTVSTFGTRCSHRASKNENTSSTGKESASMVWEHPLQPWRKTNTSLSDTTSPNCTQVVECSQERKDALHT